jgi:basic membrane protein A and related proteins
MRENAMKIMTRWLLAGAMTAIATASAAQTDDKLFVYVSPDPIGVNAFLKMGQTGIEAAGKQFQAEVKTYESRTAADRLDNVNAAVNEGADVVVLLGFEFNDIVKEVAATAPDTQFLIVDQCIDERPDNVHCAVFREYEASYLMGVAAGMLTESKKVGVVGALDIPFLHRYTDGYAQGVKSVAPDVEVDIRWVGGENPFADPVRAKEQAVAMHAAGSDLIFTATAGGDFGVFEAAKEGGFKVFSVDVNQCPQAPGHVLDMTLKRVDNAMVQAIDAILEGQKQTMSSLGLKEGGMSAMALEDDQLASSQCEIAKHPEVIEKMKAVAASIVDGSLKLEDPMFAK